MNGQPVWLASFSRRDASGRIILTGQYSAVALELAIDALRRLLSGVGDVRRERVFRMNVSVCMHRAITDGELRRLPAWFHAAEVTDLAGGPIEILWENVEQRESTRPCAAPIHLPSRPGRNVDPETWFPGDCGQCASCLARAEIAPRTG